MLTPEARKLAAELGLHPFDYEWIANVPALQQCDSVRKCTGPMFDAWILDKPKSRLYTRDGGVSPYEI